MISDRTLKALEYDKVLSKIEEYAVLDNAKEKLCKSVPSNDINEAEILLKMTAEGYKLLFNYNVGGVEFFDELGDELSRASKGSTLNMAELLRVSRLLKSSRLLRSGISSVNDDEIVYLKNTAQALFCDQFLENSIREKIVSEDQMSDHASEALYQIRRKIRRINEQIKTRLASYLHGEKSKYLQEGIVTMRGDRYVVPVKSEYKGQIKGLIHDQSSSGATVFVEPEQILEMNNDLKMATLEEQSEIMRILTDLSNSVGAVSKQLEENIGYASDIDIAFAKATYAYKTRSVMPKLNDRGYVRIVLGRHPLIDANKVVPLNIELGRDFKFLIITGPNTGGKTVTLKLIGLFTLMAMSGMYVLAGENTHLSVFNDVFTDIGDEQSIEQSLSTFSSHINNIIGILNAVSEKSLVLIDEIGAGTDPDEGGALAQSIIKFLIDKNCFGITTTHYSKLKEYAYSDSRLMNASMDFDPKTFEPLYKLNIGIPGSSNAIEISRRLGINGVIADYAYSLLSENKISFDNVLKEAEKSRQDADKIRSDYEVLLKTEKDEYEVLRAERLKFDAEKDRFYKSAKIEARRIVNEKLEEADNIVEQMQAIFDKEELTGGDIINVRTLRNKLEKEKYLQEDKEVFTKLTPIDFSKLKQGDSVYIKSMDSVGTIESLSPQKKEANVLIGNIRGRIKYSDLFLSSQVSEKAAPTVKVVREASTEPFRNELNVIGLNVDEALAELESFLDKCVMMNIEETRIVHGVGLKKLSTAIQAYLKKHPRVSEFRFGKYGEGERGVTIVKFK